MKYNSEMRHRLISLTDLEWFDAMCDILKRKSCPTVHKLTGLIGIEKPNPKNEIRGSKFIDTYDNRFQTAYINPNLTHDDPDQPLDYLGFWGEAFAVKIGDIVDRFNTYQTQTNTYDGGTQIFFYPVLKKYEFSAIDCWTRKEINEINNLLNLNVNGVTFMFGDNLTRGRTGYHMRRTKPIGANGNLLNAGRK